MSLLEVEVVTAGYAGVPVLHDIDLAVDPGEIVAVLGRNGAGKSTLVGAIAGTLPVTGGSIRFAGADVTRKPASARHRRGLRVMRQDRAVFAEMTVLENLRLAGLRGTAAVEGLFPFLAGRGAQIAGTLSGGERKMLVAARTLMAPGRLCVLDEPTEGLQPSNVDVLAEAIVRVAGSGSGIVLVEQHLDMALSIAHRWCLLEKGCVVDHGDVTADTLHRAARQLAI